MILEMDAEHKRAIEEVIREMECPKGFKCQKTGFKQAGKVRLLAEGRVIECMEEDGRSCGCGLFYGSGVFCECPLRQYIARNFPAQRYEE
jgi:hypothetical protein